MWPNYWSFSFSISPSNEYLGLISFRSDWYDLLAVQGTLKSLLQHHNLKASVLQCSTFFIVQLSHLNTTTGKAIDLTIWTFVMGGISHGGSRQSPTPGVYPNSWPLTRWCHLTISSSVIPFSSCLQSFPTSGSFQMSQLFTSGGQNTGVSASTPVLPMNTQLIWVYINLCNWRLLVFKFTFFFI